MSGETTVADALARAAERRRRKRCRVCDGVVSIRGLGGEYGWTCLDCEALGFGYATRAGALEAAGRFSG